MDEWEDGPKGRVLTLAPCHALVLDHGLGFDRRPSTGSASDWGQLEMTETAAELLYRSEMTEDEEIR